MPHLLQAVICLSPPNGPPLISSEKETWLGRNSFKLSEKARLLCSRRQACLKFTNSVVQLECHGLNPIFFVVCHSANFQASQDSPPSKLHHLRKGEVVELAGGDKFFLAPEECLLTVGIKLIKSDHAKGVVQYKSDGVDLNVHDDRSLADQACSLKSTQLGQALTNSPVKNEQLLQAGAPASENRLLNVGIKLIKSEHDEEAVQHTSDGAGLNGYDYRSLGDQVCSLNSPELEQAFTNSRVKQEQLLIKSGHDESTLQHTSEGVDFNVHDNRSFPDQVYSHTSSQLGQASTNSRVLRERLFQPLVPATPLLAEVCIKLADRRLSGEICNLDPTFKLQVSSIENSPARQVSESTAHGDHLSSEFAVDARRPSDMSKVTVVQDGHHAGQFRRLGSSAVGALLYPSQGVTLAAGSSGEGKGCGSNNYASEQICGQNVQPDTINLGLELRGPSHGFGKGDALDVSEQITTGNAFGCTSSLRFAASGGLALDEVDNNTRRLIGSSKITIISDGAVQTCPEPKQGEDDTPTAKIPGLAPLQIPPQQWLPPNNQGVAENAVASTSGTTPGKHKAVAMSETSLKEGNIRANFPPEALPSSISPSLDVTSSELPMNICEVYNVDDNSELQPKQSEPVDLTTSENETNSQAKIQLQGAHVGQSTAKYYGTGPVEGVENLVVTISGYEPLLKARLIHLILATGALHTGSLTKMNTHVVCWKFSGAKYEMAKKLGTTLVNHCWFEDCLKSGMRLPEERYRASGEMSEPLLWEQSILGHHASTARREQDCIILTSQKHYSRQAQNAIVVGEASDQFTRSGNRPDHSGLNASSSRRRLRKADRGKDHVNLNSSLEGLQDSTPGTLRRVEDVSAMNLSTPPRAQVHESDEFWNEVIREFDGTGKQITEHSCQGLSEGNRRAKPIGDRARQTASTTISGSLIRDVDPKGNNDEIRSGSRNAFPNEAESSRVVKGGIPLETTESHPFVEERSNNVPSEDGLSTSYPEVLRRKRMLAFAKAHTKATAKRQRGRLIKMSEISAASGHSPVQLEIMDVNNGGIRTGSQPTANNVVAQDGGSTVLMEDDCQQKAPIIVESVDKSCENGGNSGPSYEIACCICHSDTMPNIEGVLGCGHQFCYPCIQRWSDEAKLKSPTCPLCKVPFDFITYREMGKALDGSCPVVEERIVQIGKQIWEESHTNLPSLQTENVCLTCGSRDTPELLLVCTTCRERACHTFCLDPPQPPGSSWFCSRCSQMQTRIQTREAYGRLFLGNSPSLSSERQQDPDVGMI